MDLSDEALIEKYRRTKDIIHFKSLVRRYQNRLYTVAVRILAETGEAEEVVQDTFLKVHQNLDSFRKEASFAAWIFRITHNHCVDKLRFKQRKRGVQTLSFDPQSTFEQDNLSECSLSAVTQLPDPNPGPAQQLDHNEREEMIVQSLEQLPDSQRAVLVLHDIEGFSYQEIANIVGASIGTVRSRLHYGRIRLKELLKPYFANSNNVSATSR